MRALVIFLLLVLSAAVQAAAPVDVDVDRCWQPDGPYDEPAKCPGRISDPAVSALATTSFTFNHSTTNTSGTIHYWIKANPTGAACNTLAPTRKQITTGSGATVYTTGSISGAGAQSKSITGLTADTAYCAFVIEIRAYKGTNRFTRDVQTKPVSSGPPSMDLAGFFVGTGGCSVYGATQSVDGVSVLCDGTAHARRFDRLSIVPTTAPAGTDIWILTGSTITLTANISTNWGGTDTSATSPGRAYIASYYLDGGTPRATWEGSTPGTLNSRDSTTGFTTNVAGPHTLPIIQGGLSQACLQARNCNWNPQNSGVAGTKNECKSLSGDGMLTINKSNVTVRGLHFRYGSCRGIQFAGTPTTFSNSVLQGNIIRHFGMQLMVAQNGQFTVAKGNIFGASAQCFWSKQRGGTQEPEWSGASNCAAVQGDGHTGGAVVSSNNPQEAYFGFVDNLFARTPSEGIQCLKTTHVWFKGNRAGNTAYTPNYVDGCKNTISESNVFWGTKGDVGDPNDLPYFTGLGEASPMVIVERKASAGAPDTINNIFRNNLVAGFNSGFRINKQSCINQNTGEVIVGCNTAAKLIGSSGYHNTFVGLHPTGFLRFQGPQRVEDAVDWAAAWRKGDWRNNIFAGSEVSSSSCYADADATYNYNLWGEVVNASCRGANDIGGSGVARNPRFTTRNTWTTSDAGAPGVTDATNAAWWNATTWSNPPPPDYVRVTVGTNTGADLNGTGTCAMTITDAELANWATIAHEMDYPYSLDADSSGAVTAAEMANWRACAYYDFWGNPRGDSPDVGLHEFGGSF